PSSESRDGGTARSFSWPAVRPAHLSNSVSRWKSSQASSAWRSARMRPGSARSTGGTVHSSVIAATVVLTGYLGPPHSRATEIAAASSASLVCAADPDGHERDD